MGICASGDNPGQKRKSTNLNSNKNWVWSESLKGDRIKISEKGKVAHQTQKHEWDTALVDQPLNSGKYSWKIKLTQDISCLIGV